MATSRKQPHSPPSTARWWRLVLRTRPAALSLAMSLFVLGCAGEAPSDSFYQPPDERSKSGLELESGADTCERWRQTRLAHERNGTAGVSQELQQQFLLFGFEEIRVDPLAPSTTGAEHHVTASVRGRTRDTILVVATVPPADQGNLAPLTAVARLWSLRADPENPPAMTVRFAVVPSSDALTTDQVIANYLVQRPRTVAQTRAVVALDPTADPGLHTNRENFRVFLDNIGTENGLVTTTEGPHSAVRVGLAATFSRLQLPTIWSDLSWSPETSDCQGEGANHLESASRLLLDLIDGISDAFSEPTPDTETVHAGAVQVASARLRSMNQEWDP